MLASALVRVGALVWPMTKACAQDDEQQALIIQPGITDKVVVFIVCRLGSSSDQRMSGVFCCHQRPVAVPVVRACRFYPLSCAVFQSSSRNPQLPELKGLASLQM